MVVGGTVEVGVSTSVVVERGRLDVVVNSVATAPLEHPAANAQRTIAVSTRGIVTQPVTGDLPLSVMKRMACLAIGLTVLAGACNVDEGATTTDTLPPLGTPSNTVPPTTATTVATTDVVAVATSTIALPSGA